MSRASRLLAAACGLSCCLWAPLSLAQVIPQPSPHPEPARIDATLLHARRALRERGPQSRFFGAAQPDPAQAALLVTMRDASPCPDVAGARWITRAAGGPLERARLCAGWAPWGALEALGAHPAVASARWAGAPLLALSGGAPLVSTQQAASGLRRRLGGLDGAGVTIVDIDGPVDLLHPALFEADGGAYDWVDVDGDGRLTLGVDGVDLDRDGRVSPRERLSLVDASRVGSGVDEDSEDRRFAPDEDWLYVDRNNDQRRNAGPADGFGEADLAYGEPIFIADDMDQDGALGVGERVIRLGRSKIVAVVDGALRYERGVDLIRAAYRVDDSAFHGTAVAGILVGGQPAAHTLTGVAPGAALEVHVLRQPSEALVRVVAALEAAPQRAVVAHEWSLPGELMDGGTALDAALAQAALGAPQLVAAGNMHLARRHVTRRVEGAASLTFIIPADEPLAGRVEVVVQHHSSATLKLALRAPSGAASVAADGLMEQVSWGQIAWSRERSASGAQLWRAVMWVEQGQLEAGDWRLELESGAPVEVWARVFDLGSPWLRGVGWAEAAPVEGTLVMPAAAQGALVMTALGGLEPQDDGSQPGELRRYAGRGPTLGGALPLMVAAPDDPYSPLYLSEERAALGWGVGWYAPFGGTSGALAVGAGAAALLRQARPDLDAPALVAQLVGAADGAALDPQPARLPDVGWGSGRLDLERVLGGLERGEAAPLARVEAAHDAAGTLMLDASGCEDPDGGPVEVWIDVGYDGRAEIEWEQAGRWTLDDEACEGAGCLVRVQVRDGQGQQAGALIVVGAALEPSGMELEPPLPGSDGPQSGCLCAAATPASGGGGWWGVMCLWGFVAARRLRVYDGRSRRAP